jgi:hypothetical protein
VFFEAGSRAWRSDVLARLALERGDFAAGLAHARAGVFDRAGAAERVGAAQRFFADAGRLGFGSAELLRALDLLLGECALDAVQARKRAPMERRAETLLRAAPGERAALLAEAERRFGGLGPAGATFLAALRASGG